MAPEERYAFIARTVRRFGYARLKRADKSVALRFLARVRGYSRQQLTRLVRRVRTQAPLLKRYRASRTSFCAYLYSSRCAAAGTHRYPARHALRTGHQEAHGARLPRLWRSPL